MMWQRKRVGSKPTFLFFLLTNYRTCAIIPVESEVNAMVEIIDFVLANAESIVSYEVVGYSMDATIVEFTMVNGEKIQKDF